MIYEKSCGAVIYFPQAGGPLFLVEKMQLGHTSLCKGHVEPGETEHDTARREIAEETALQVDFLDGFRERIEYSPFPGHRKEVIFFLARAEGQAVTPQEAEVAELFWLLYEEARQALTHASDREVLAKARQFLEQHGESGGC